MQRGKKFNVEEDDTDSDSEVIMKNNRCILLAVEGNELLVYIQRCSGYARIPLNDYL